MTAPSLTRRTLLKTALAGGIVGFAGCDRPAKTSHDFLPAPALFQDATVAAGLDFIQSSAACGMFYFPEQFAAGASLLDANGDGFLDVYFPAPKPLGTCVGKIKPQAQRLYRNNGHGHFTLDTDAFGGHDTDYGLGSAVGDYNNDGHHDLYVCCAGRNTLYRNRGDGTFEDVTEQAGVGVGNLSMGAVWLDYDGDGFLDLYVLRYCDWHVATDTSCLGPNRMREFCKPETYAPSVGILFHNNGDGTFTDVTERAGIAGLQGRGLAVAAADFDGDGRLDLWVANDIGSNFLLHNKGDGTFEDVGLREGCAFGLEGQYQSNMGIAVGDIFGTGRLDALVTTFSDEPYTLYRNDGGYFTDVSAQTGIAQATLPYLGFGTGLIDVKNSGLLDVFFANGHVYPTVAAPYTYKQPNLLMLNDGTGHFVSHPDALPADDVRVHRGACFGDLDNDGRIDILVTANNDRPTLLRNQSPPANWLLLRLIDHHGCATPVGTQCIATIHGKTLLRVALGGGSYGGASDPRMHFGLGSAPQADIEIRWLSGQKQTLKAVPANQILTVREGVAPPGIMEA